MDLSPLIDSNKIFRLVLWFILLAVLVFLLTPVIAVLLNGCKFILPAACSKEVRFSLALSLKTASKATFICMVLALCSSYAMRQLPQAIQKILYSFLSIPMSLPHLVSGVALLLVYGRMGIGNWLYRVIGIDFVYTEKGITLALVFVNLSYAIIMMYSAYNERQEQLEFTARTLGCTKTMAFFKITLPLSMPSFLSAAVMTWSRALGEFGAVIMIAGSTRMKTEILPTAIFLNMATGDLDIALGISVILILVSVLCILLLQFIAPEMYKRRGSNAHY